MTDVGEHYRRSRLRIIELLEAQGLSAWDRAVPACPGWDVHDVVAHLVGVIEDAMAGRLDGPPGEVLTAEEVSRHRGELPQRLLVQWMELAPFFEAVLTEQEIWPAMTDVLSHEHDIRGALGRPGAREVDSVVLAARRLIDGADVRGTLQVDLGTEIVRSPTSVGPVYELRTTPFEVLRFRLGRRTRAQVLALDWSPDPAAIVDGLFVFGPAATALVE